MATADVNWMLSSTAQSSAALVAIVGGLQGARYVSLHAEQQAARRRRDDLARRAAAAQERFLEHQERLDRHWVDGALLDHDVFEAIVKNDFVLSVDDALDAADTDDTGLPPDLLRERLDEVCTSLREARDRLAELVPVREDRPSWDEFRRANALTPDEDETWRWVYRNIAESREAEARKQKRRNDPYGLGTSSLLLSSLRSFPSPEVRAIRSLREDALDRAHEERLIAYRDDAKRNYEQLGTELLAAEAHLADVEQPEGFRLALQVLSVLTLVGVVVPSVIMAAGVQSLPGYVRAGVVGGFVACIALLVRYLFVYAAYLSDRHARQHLPANTLRLVIDRRPREVPRLGADDPAEVASPGDTREPSA